tara:strand:- start:1961 stop:4216 length:2256 start_codon:yes stop_codon:yes gene_type:complete
LARYVIRIARQAGLVASFVTVAILGTTTGVLFTFAGDLPQISALDDYAPKTITRVYARNGETIGEFATQRRVVIAYEDISPYLRDAIIAAEDAGFYSHVGLSISRLAITIMRDVVRGELAGASTLTQQLARNLFLTQEKTLTRKIKELLLSFQIEKRYTKTEILALYCNQILFGHGAYGVEAASRMYFNKSATDLKLEEAALLAGIIQAPARQSPFVNIERATQRRNYALTRMEDEEFISAEEAVTARAKPISVLDRRREKSIAPYFVEEVRQHLEANYGVEQLYEEGLAVHTSLNVELQMAANRAVTNGLHRLDKRRGFRKPTRNLAKEEIALDEFDHARWNQPIATGDRIPAIVTVADANHVVMRSGKYQGTIEREGFRWTRRQAANQLLEVGDLILVQVTSIDESRQTLTATLDQEPLAEGALLAIDNRTGQILAMVGGYNFERSKFNRTVQASRQLGSLFKAVLYATAIDRGYTPTSIIMDEPVSLSPGPDQPEYSPENYDKEFIGPVTLRYALEKSRNVPAVQVIADLGPQLVADYARRFGFISEIPSFLSIALGAGEATLLEITSAYSIFPNLGVRLEPYEILRITDRAGNLLEENRPMSYDSLPADTAYIMTSLLRGVVERGTGQQAAGIPWPLAGKTGTVDEYTDAWFVGFDPEITVGVWVGHDEKRTLGDGEEGARAALPIWIEFMRAHIGERADAPTFRTPSNIVFLSVDRMTGNIVAPSSPDAIHEAFISGTEPGINFQQ